MRTIKPEQATGIRCAAHPSADVREFAKAANPPGTWTGTAGANVYLYCTECDDDLAVYHVA